VNAGDANANGVHYAPTTTPNGCNFLNTSPLWRHSHPWSYKQPRLQRASRVGSAHDQGSNEGAEHVDYRLWTAYSLSAGGRDQPGKPARWSNFDWNTPVMRCGYFTLRCGKQARWASSPLATRSGSRDCSPNWAM